ncbi:baseplate J/gp47 family protein [Aggregatibacter actinomycetemcomitans]|uniref:baseplate J/gp47 family protein n=1 Tax=Aggregatibacter actinomycetemcomitans TaxID=714 RepID=UPI00197C6691|nr:baseplate J/gp47 family protein [Aggregatibacter actinomycetemcomitans]MBN6060147.1 baseplate J/gp47 family protein [Aggregatibacter actinomycetemcomitans]MBN6088852.1 baseplate J/gp47 family protein [Aggregatibacter actinomycetemcomitans]
MAKLIQTGIQIERLSDIITRFEEGFRQIYGQNIDLSPDTPDGQMAGLLSQIKMDIEELAENVYRQLDPDVATGTWLEQRVAYAGLMRRAASYSYLRSVVLTGEPLTQLYAGIVVSDPHKVRWVLNANVQLDSNGSARADFRSEELGAFNLAKNTNLTIETVTLGLNAATTLENAEIGVEEETDQQLRERFFISRTKNAQNSADAIQSKIAALPDVKQVKVLENNTKQRDKNGVEPHSLNVIVDGGADNQIAQVIYENKGAGVGLQGGTETTLTINNERRTLRFDRVVQVDVQVSMRCVRYEDFTEVDKDEIKRLLSIQKFEIGQNLSLSRLYSPINQVGGFWIKELKIGRKGQALKAENVIVQPRELARILASDITIEVE